MTEHVCKWEIKEMGNEVWIECSIEDCFKGLTYNQAEGMLNEYETLKKATDALSAEMARKTDKALAAIIADYADVREAQRAYADILEGK